MAKIATDRFEWKKTNYLIIILSILRWQDFQHQHPMMSSHTWSPSSLTMESLRQWCQIMVHSMQRQPLLKEYGFTHITSSPRYPQSKRAVRTVKNLLDKNRDPYAALLAYRSTPLENGYSPAELLMGRKLRTTVPVALTQLVPHLPNFSKLKEKEKQLRERQRKNFNHHHHTVNLKPLQTGDNVRNSGNWNQSTVICGADPRWYLSKEPSTPVAFTATRDQWY